MPETTENRDTFALGTRVRPYASLSPKRGTVVEVTEDGRMFVRWDDQESFGPLGPYSPMEIFLVKDK